MHTAPQPPAPPRTRPVAGLGTAAIALGAAVLAACLLRLVASWWTYQVLFLGPDDAVITLGERLRAAALLLLTAAVLVLPTALAAVATTLVWVHRARTNAGMLSPHLRFRYSPAASVWLLLVPVANVYFIGPVLGDICAASFPYGRDARGARLVRAFWLTTIATVAGAAVGNTALSLATAQLYGAGRMPDETTALWAATAGNVFETVVHLLAVGCTVLFALVVRRVSRLQTTLLTTPASV